jgi:hypothetical protein
VREGDAVEIVLAAGAALEQELAPLGYDDHFGRAAVAPGERLYREDYADIVMAQDSDKFFRSEMCAASRHCRLLEHQEQDDDQQEDGGDGA